MDVTKTDESNIDITIVIKKEMDNQTKKRFISWAADMDIRYERVFSIVDIQEENIKKWKAAYKNWPDTEWRGQKKCCV